MKNEKLNHVDGYPSYYAKHGDIDVYEPEDIWDNIISKKISLPPELKNKLIKTTLKTDVFKIHVRNLIIVDWLGNLLYYFIISVENEKFSCIEITYNSSRDCYTLSDRNRDDCEIMFDKNLNLEPYTMLLNEDITIHNLLNDDTLESRHPVISCDIIDEKNALRL